MSERPPDQNDDLKAFLIVLHRALRMICVHIEKRYEIGDHKEKRAA
jgi:hypothetical protein